MQDFLDKLDDELDNMQPKKKVVEVKNNEVVIESISNNKDKDSKSELEKKIEEKIKKYDYSKKSNFSSKNNSK
jgi:hypothetical protein